MLGREFLIKVCLSFVLIVSTFRVSCQVFTGPTRPGEPGVQTTTNQTVSLDSAEVLFVQPHELEFRDVPQLTLENFQQINPAWRGEFDMVHLGNVGAPSKNIVYQPRIRQGLDHGYHAYDLYYYPRSETRFYNTPLPFTDLFYTARGQEDAIITATFSQNLSRSLNAAIDYRKINHKGGYTDQRVRHTNVVISSWLRSKNDRYMAFFSWNNNIIKNQNNGGIEADSLLDDPRYINQRSIIPVNLNSAQTEYKHSELSFTHFLQFPKRKNQAMSWDTTNIFIDTTLADRTSGFSPPRVMQPLNISNTTLRHQLNFRNIDLKFFDTAPEPDSSFYGEFQTNQRGVRNYTRVRQIQNVFSTKIEVGKERSASLLFEPALIYTINVVNEEPDNFVVNDLFAAGTLELHTPADRIGLTLKAHVGIGENVGDLMLDGIVNVNFDKFGSIQAGVLQQIYEPSLFQNRLLVSEEEIWQTDFNRTNELNLSFWYSLPKFNFRIGTQYHLIDNYIYVDQQKFPQQAGSVVNILQLILEKDFHLGKFHFLNMFVFQETSDLMRLPRYWSRHNLFFETKLFDKIMLARFGIDLRYNTNYKADAYFPLFGQFHLQDDTTLEYIPRADAYISARVKTFRAFVKMENLTQLIFQENNLAAPLYPMRDWYIRLGIGWRFFD